MTHGTDVSIITVNPEPNKGFPIIFWPKHTALKAISRTAKQHKSQRERSMTYCPKRRTQAGRTPLLGEATHRERRSSRKPHRGEKGTTGRATGFRAREQAGVAPPAALWPVTC